MLHTLRSVRQRTILRLEALEDRLAPATLIWSGGGGNANWSNPANWGGTGVPGGGDDLQFPTTAFTASNHDITDLTLSSVTFTTGTGYTVTGLSISLGGTLAANNTTGANRVDADVSFSSSVTTITVAGAGTLTLNGTVSSFLSLAKDGTGTLVLAGSNSLTGFSLSAGTLTVANNNALGTGSLFLVGGTTLQADSSPRTLSNTFSLSGPAPITLGGTSALTLTGGGSLVASAVTLNVTNTATTTLNGDLRLGTTSSGLTKSGGGTLVLGGTNTYGSTLINAGTLFVNGTQSGNSVAINAGATLGGTGNAGIITAFGGFIAPGISPGILRGGDATFSATSTFRVELNGIMPGTGHDQLDLTASATLGGSILSASLGFTAAINDSFVILRAAQGRTGTFSGLIDGALLAINGKPFRINYAATTVTLTRVQGSTTLAVSAVPSTTTFGQAITFTATVTPSPTGSSVPTGTITFREGTSTLGTGTLNAAGQATFSTNLLTATPHNIDAVYGGDPDFTGSTAAPIAVTVNRALTTQVLTTSSASTTFGESLTLTAQVSGPAGTPRVPSGQVTFRDGNTNLATVTLDATGRATFTTTALNAGTHPLSLVYSGDNDFAGATSPPLAFVVNRANTTTTLTASSLTVPFGQPVILRTTVAAVAPGSGTPTGSTIFSAFPDGQPLNVTTLGTAILTNGTGRFVQSGLIGTCEVVSANYLGDANFNASTSMSLRISVSFSPNQAFVFALYRDVLERQFDSAGFNFWVARLEAGGSRAEVATAFWQSGEHRGLQIDTFYRLLLRRPADAAGRAAWVNALVGGMSEVEIVAAFVGSAEYTAIYPTAQNFVAGLYADLLQRGADNAGLSFWTQVLQTGARSRGDLAYYFLTSSEAYNKALADYYIHFLGRTAGAAEVEGLLRALEVGSSPVEVAAVFLASSEYFQRAQRIGC